MLEEIKQKAQEIANNRSKQIILGVYQNMINRHNEFCGCNYCVILTEYVQMKRWLCANNRIMNSVDYDFWDNGNCLKDLDRIKIIKQKIKELRQQKNQLKLL